MIYRLKEHSCFKHNEFRGLNAHKSLSYRVMGLWDYWVMGFWGSGVWGLWGFGIMGFVWVFVLMLLSFIIFSLFFEVRKKLDVMGLFGHRIRFQHGRLHIVR